MLSFRATSRDVRKSFADRVGIALRRMTPGRLLGMVADRQFCKKNCREKRMEAGWQEVSRVQR